MYFFAPESDGSYQGYIEGEFIYAAAEEGEYLQLLCGYQEVSVVSGLSHNVQATWTRAIVDRVIERGGPITQSGDNIFSR